MIHPTSSQPKHLSNMVTIGEDESKLIETPLPIMRTQTVMGKINDKPKFAKERPDGLQEENAKLKKRNSNTDRALAQLSNQRGSIKKSSPLRQSHIVNEGNEGSLFPAPISESRNSLNMSNHFLNGLTGGNRKLTKKASIDQRPIQHENGLSKQHSSTIKGAKKQPDQDAHIRRGTRHGSQLTISNSIMNIENCQVQFGSPKLGRGQVLIMASGGKKVQAAVEPSPVISNHYHQKLLHQIGVSAQSPTNKERFVNEGILSKQSSKFSLATIYGGGVNDFKFVTGGPQNMQLQSRKSIKEQGTLNRFNVTTAASSVNAYPVNGGGGALHQNNEVITTAASSNINQSARRDSQFRSSRLASKHKVSKLNEGSQINSSNNILIVGHMNMKEGRDLIGVDEGGMDEDSIGALDSLTLSRLQKQYKQSQTHKFKPEIIDSRSNSKDLLYASIESIKVTQSRQQTNMQSSSLFQTKYSVSPRKSQHVNQQQHSRLKSTVQEEYADKKYIGGIGGLSPQHGHKLRQVQKLPINTDDVRSLKAVSTMGGGEITHRKHNKNVSRFQDTVNTIGSPYKTLTTNYNEERIAHAYLNSSKKHMNTVKKIYCKGKTLQDRSPQAAKHHKQAALFPQIHSNIQLHSETPMSTRQVTKHQDYEEEEDVLYQPIASTERSVIELQNHLREPQVLQQQIETQQQVEGRSRSNMACQNQIRQTGTHTTLTENVKYYINNQQTDQLPDIRRSTIGVQKEKFQSVKKDKNKINEHQPSKFIKKTSMFGVPSHSVSIAHESQGSIKSNYQKSTSPKQLQDPSQKDLDTDTLKPNGNIHISVNQEDSILSYLTQDHKANMSLLFYDFNNSNQRLKHKIQAHHPGQNIADLVIPEEEGDYQGENAGGPGTVERGESLQQEENPYIMTQQDEQLLTRQESLLREILNGTAQGIHLQPNNNSQIHLRSNMDSKVSPRNADVDMVNQKIDNAKRKMSRYFPARNGLNIPSQGQQEGTLGATNPGALPVQKSLSYLSMDMVRLSSPFFGVGGQPALHSPAIQQQSAFTSRLDTNPPINDQYLKANLKTSSAADILIIQDDHHLAAVEDQRSPSK